MRKLLEVFNSPVEYKVTNKSVGNVEGQWEVLFKTENDNYIFESLQEDSFYVDKIRKYFETLENKILPVDVKVWNIAFSSESMGYFSTGHNEPNIVFSTVFKIIEEWFKEVKPKIIVFAAKEDEESRIKLYRSLAKELENKYSQTFKFLGSSDSIPSLKGKSEYVYFWVVVKGL